MTMIHNDYVAPKAAPEMDHLLSKAPPETSLLTSRYDLSVKYLIIGNLITIDAGVKNELLINSPASANRPVRLTSRPDMSSKT